MTTQAPTTTTQHPASPPSVQRAGSNRKHPCARWLAWALTGALVVPQLGGCAVIAVADVAASIAVGTAGLAVDAAVGTAKIAGKVVGKSADLVLGSGSEP